MKRFYNWFHAYYGSIEKSLDPKIEAAVQQKISIIPEIKTKTALDYACGSGLLTLHLSKIFRSVSGKDASSGMLERARARALEAGSDVSFQEGNILEPVEQDKSYDYVFVSFALHLFSPEDEKFIIQRFLSVAREAVIIIDHKKKRDFPTAFVEWIEGSHYDLFIKLDFKRIALEINASKFEELEIEDCSLMIFYC